MSALDVVLETDVERRDLLLELKFIEELFATEEKYADDVKSAKEAGDTDGLVALAAAKAEVDAKPPAFTWKDGVSPEERMTRVYERLEDVSSFVPHPPL